MATRTCNTTIREEKCNLFVIPTRTDVRLKISILGQSRLLPPSSYHPSCLRLSSRAAFTTLLEQSKAACKAGQPVSWSVSNCCLFSKPRYFSLLSFIINDRLSTQGKWEYSSSWPRIIIMQTNKNRYTVVISC